MNEITQMFVQSLNNKPEEDFVIHTNCERYNQTQFATLTVAEDFSKELKSSGYNARVLNSSTGEILFTA